MLTETFWERYFSTYDILNRALPYQQHLQALTEAVAPAPGDLILDLGSGTGNLSRLLAGAGAEVVGVDYSTAGIRLHQAKLPGARVHQHDITQPLPFADGTFSKVVSNSVLYTIDPTRRAAVIREVARVLKPGGRFVLSNVKTTFRPLTVLQQHLRTARRRHGVVAAATELITLAAPVVRMLRYNALITREGHGGNYSFFAEGEQRDLLAANGFRCVHPTLSSYADQSYIDVAEKPRP